VSRQEFHLALISVAMAQNGLLEVSSNRPHDTHQEARSLALPKFTCLIDPYTPVRCIFRLLNVVCCFAFVVLWCCGVQRVYIHSCLHIVSFCRFFVCGRGVFCLRQGGKF
jgi:hypothetical protein